MAFPRHTLPSPIRYAANFFVYKRYLKEFDEDNAHNRNWLYQFNRNIQKMGFNEGIEAFETWYEGSQKIDRSMVQRRLEKISEQEEYVPYVPLTSKEYDLKYNVGQKAVKPKQRRDYHEDIDISHVDRAMGNNHRNDDDDINRILDDIF